jgi:hypothetical protein
LNISEEPIILFSLWIYYEGKSFGGMDARHYGDLKYGQKNRPFVNLIRLLSSISHVLFPGQLLVSFSDPGRTSSFLWGMRGRLNEAKSSEKEPLPISMPPLDLELYSNSDATQNAMIAQVHLAPRVSGVQEILGLLGVL